MQIRPATPADLDVLAQIYTNERRRAFHWQPHERFQNSDLIKDTEGEVVFVATEQERPIGFVSLWTADNFIHHLYVDFKYQNRRVGQALLQHAVQILSRPARLKCVVQNLNACRFYEKNGWQIESTTHDGPEGPYHTYRLDETV